MFDILKNIGYSVWSVQLYISLLLIYIGLVTHRLKCFPNANQVLNNTNIRTGLDIKVTSIKESSNIKARNQLKWFVLCVSCWTLPVKVEVVCVRWSLTIAFLEGLTVPYSVGFTNKHMVHVDRNPDITCGICDPVIYIVRNDKVACSMFTILDIINSGLFYGGEIKLSIMILEVITP